jgi:uncharacterized protein YkwD
MERPDRTPRTLARTAISAALLCGLVAIAGCGGGSKQRSTSAVAADRTADSGIVAADGTVGLVGPAGRATSRSQSFIDHAARISPNANRRTPAIRHGVAGGAACADGGLMPSAGNLAQIDAAILCLVNAERADNGLSVLQQSSQLQQAAEGMAQRMVTEQFFAHDTPDGKNVVDRVEPTGYIPRSGDWVVGENLAWGSGGLSTPQAIVNGWMNSPGHRANVLAPDYKDIGLASAMGSPIKSQSGGAVFVNNFGARSGADLNASLPASSQATTAAKKKAAARKRAARKRAAARKAAAKKAAARKKNG